MLFDTGINANIYLAGIPKCYNPACSNFIIDYGTALWLASAHGTVGFCSFPCLLRTLGQFLHQQQAMKSVLEVDHLARLGYKPPEEGEREH